MEPRNDPQPSRRRLTHRSAGLLGLALLVGWVLPAQAADESPGAPSAGPVASPSPSGAGTAGTAGARTLGDPFYPTLGNGGYDTTAIDLVVSWTAPAMLLPNGRADVRTTLEAVATQDLSALTLDLAPTATVARVTVDGVTSDHHLDPRDRKLVIVLPEARIAGTPFTLVIDSTAVPALVPRTGEDGSFVGPDVDLEEARIREGRGLIADGAGGIFLAAQPNGAHTVFPVNDHPLDKAPMRITLTAPPGMLGVASGALERATVGLDGALTTTWASASPVASHVVALGIGDLALVTSGAAAGIGLRSAIPTDIEPVSGALLAEIPGILGWLEEAIGVPYPFETFGLLAYAGRPTEAILEGQTLVLLPGGLLGPFVDRCVALGLIVHEAAHQWFGNFASIARWDHKWLSEGNATYYEWRWLAEHDCLPVPRGRDPGTGPAVDPSGAPSAVPSPRLDPASLAAADAEAAAAALDARMHRAYRAAAGIRSTYGPPSAPVDQAAVYTPAIYDQGALALYALRLEVGDETFERIQRAFLREFGDSAAATDDLIALASSVAGRDLEALLRPWLFGAGVPSMPGRPRWRSIVPEPSPSPSAAVSPSPAASEGPDPSPTSSPAP